MKSPEFETERRTLAPHLTRRQVFGLLLSTAISLVLVRRGLAGPVDPSNPDQGIGGTGVAPSTNESDRGIGGTGVIGTIRKFGSIIVNDLRIAYPQDAEVRIDGQPAAVSDLRIGQVVRVAAAGPDSALSTHTIDVTSEVVGPVEKVGAKQLIVLGQKVATAGLKTSGLKPGDIVAVSGLRRNDGTIVASLIERSPGAAARVAGPLTSTPDGTTRIGGLVVSGVDPGLFGHRVIVEGTQSGDRLVATHATSETALFPSSVRTLSIESYVERHDGSLRLGSGFAITSANGIDVPAGRSVRAVLRTSLGADGRLIVDSVRANNRTYGPGRGGRPGKASGPGNGGGPGGGGRGPAGSEHGFDRSGSGREGPGARGPRGEGPGGGPGGNGGGGFGEPGGRFGGPGGGFDGPGGFGGPGGGPGGGFGGPGGGGFGGPGGGGFGGGGFGGGGRH